jgi:hypothetical protein
VRKALAKDRDERFETAADLGDALSAYLFDRGIKATSKDVSLTVRDIRIGRAKRASPRAALTDALIQDEINKLTSLVAEELAAGQPEPVTSPGSMVDTTDWAADLED